MVITKMLKNGLILSNKVTTKVDRKLDNYIIFPFGKFLTLSNMGFGPLVFIIVTNSVKNMLKLRSFKHPPVSRYASSKSTVENTLPA